MRRWVLLVMALLLGLGRAAWGETFEAVVLFQTPGGLLAPESRALPRHPQDPVAQAREVLTAFLEGPRGENLRSLFPRETLVRGIFQSGSTLVVDLEIPAREQWQGSAWEEYLAVMGLVNTVLMNFPELRQVKLLVDGMEQETLAGHVDIRYPMALQRELVEEGG